MSGPISISQNGKSISTATQQELLFNTAIPFAKIDSTKKASFKVVTILFGKEPPNPATPTSTATFSNTLIYQYEHGYKYTPSTWFLISLDGFLSTEGAEGSMILISGQLPASTNAKLNITVDDTYVKIYVYKEWGYVFGQPDPVPPNVIGLSVSIRAYIFAEDLTGTSLPDGA